MPAGTRWIVVSDELQLRGDQHEPVWVRGSGGRSDRWVLRPGVIEVKTRRPGGPEVYACVEVTGDGASLRELHFSADNQGGRGVRRSDLRDVDLDFLMEDCVAALSLELDGRVLGDEPSRWPAKVGQPAEADVLRFARKLRRGQQRELNPNLLERVAQVYRANIDGAPTKAVAQEFQVSPRQATAYVSRARTRGFLPPTKQGKKQA